MTRKHTPGPWKVEHYAGASSIKGMTGGRAERAKHVLAVCPPWGPHMTDAEYAEHCANEELMAAAPELHEALEHVAHVLHAPHFAYLSECSDPSCKQAWAALKKARGES